MTEGDPINESAAWPRCLSMESKKQGLHFPSFYLFSLSFKEKKSWLIVQCKTILISRDAGRKEIANHSPALRRFDSRAPPSEEIIS